MSSYRLPPLSRARLGAIPDEIDSAFQKAIDKAPAADLIRGHARLLSELGRDDQALPLWQRLVEADASDFEACHHVAADKVARGTDPREAVERIAGGTSAVFKQRSRRVLVAPIAEAYDDARVIVICGTSFCGSTLLDRMLGSLPGVASIGESHWLTKSRRPGGTTTPIDFGLESPPYLPKCTVCGESCEVLTLDFRMDLAANRTNWYRKIAKRVGTRTLVAADKNWPKLLENDPLLRVDALVVFKSPMQAWSSQRAKLPANERAGFYEESLERHMKGWLRNYSPLLSSFRSTGRMEFLFFDAFADAEGQLFPQLSARMGLHNEGPFMDHLKKHHTIGGNRRTVNDIRADDFAVKVRRLPEVSLPIRERQMLESNTEMQDLFAELYRRHRQAYPT